MVATSDGVADSSAFTQDLAELLRALRSVDTGGRTFAGAGRGGVLADHDSWVAECLGRSEGLLDVEPLRAVWDEFRDLPPGDAEVMSHGDLIPANLVVAGDRLVGVLDTGGFGPADPALDLVVAWHLLDGEARSLLRAELAVDELEWRRGAAWAFEQAVGLVWYYRTSDSAMSALGRSTLARIASDPGLPTG